MILKNVSLSLFLTKYNFDKHSKEMLAFLLFSLISSEEQPSDSDIDEGFSSTPLPKRTPTRRTRPQESDEDHGKCAAGDLCAKRQPSSDNL